MVLDICRSLGLPTGERAIKPGALRNCKGIFITQSVFGIVPVAALDGKPAAPSPLVDRICGAYGELLART